MDVFEYKGLYVGWQSVDGAAVTSPIHCVCIMGGPPVLVFNVRSKDASAVGVSDGDGNFSSDGDAFDVNHGARAREEGGVAVGRGGGEKDSSCSVIAVGVELRWNG